MRFADASRLLLAVISPEFGDVQCSSWKDGLELVLPLASHDRVSLQLGLVLEYERKRGHTRFSVNPFLWSRDLMTHPLDALFREQSVGMPDHMRQRVIGLRERVNGRVSWIPPEFANAFSEGELLDDWDEAQLMNRLVAVFDTAHQLARVPLPARTASQLLAWEKERVRGSALASTMDRWRVSKAHE